ncbi:MAG: hypothetical protein IRZ32_18395, partial [Solirubrobacteraceae bacterium]|nr:hypothetical protein [Solirubrobacteraceae bacterium]
MRRVALVWLALSLAVPAAAGAEPTGRLLVSLHAQEGPARAAATAPAVAARAGARRAGP